MTPFVQLTAFHFSGTGNSRRLAHVFTDCAVSAGIPAEAVPLDCCPRPSVPQPGSLVGFIFPVHGFTTIWAMLAFVLRFPRAPRAGAPVWVFAACSLGAVRIGRLRIPGWEGSGLYLPLLVLWLKGYRLAGAKPFRFTPQNWTSLIPACTGASNRALMRRTRISAARFADSILSGARVFRGRVSLLFGLAIFPISLLYLLAARFFLAKLMFASSKCDGCGLCAAHCPVGAVRMIGKRPFWKLTCESCMRCMNYCPRAAVQASQPLAVALGVFLLAPVQAFWESVVRTASGAGETVTWFLAALLAAPAQIAGVALLYRAWQFSMRFKPILLAFEYTTPTRWFARYREPGTTLRDLRPGRLLHRSEKGEPINS